MNPAAALAQVILPGATVRWGTGSSQLGLTEHLGEQRRAGPIVTGHLCPACGSSEHGRPWAHDAAGRSFAVSVSHAGPHLLTAVATISGRLGVDVESYDAVTRRWPGSVVLAPGEYAESPAERAWMWVAKEAILKAYGVGLARPMSEIVLSEYAEHLHVVPAPTGYVAALALLTD